MKNIIFELLVMGLILVGGCQSGSNPENVIKDYFKYHNLHDIPKTLSFFADTARFIMTEQNQLQGRHEIRKLEEWNAAIDGKLEATGFNVRGDTVFINMIIEKNLWYKGLGIDSVVYSPGTYAVIMQGSISKFRPAPIEREYAQEVTIALKDFTEWASKERVEDIRKILQGKQFDYDHKNAPKWLELIGEWKALKDSASTSY